ncbi:STAS domain-containing protein [Streptomyces sp. NPDC050264]|uniref:STAS domain-containing protein n=1 Tax=Streptomyces sp. NPDC050264 TaxID=3155038 RepID=UPI00343C18BA
MTTYAALNLSTSASRDGVLVLQVDGALDYDTSGYFLKYATQALADHPDTRALRLDCAGLSGVDSMGLSTLLGLRRRLDQADATLHIDERSPRLDRLLTITGTFEYLVGAAASAEAEQESKGAESESGPGSESDQSDGSKTGRRAGGVSG